MLEQLILLQEQFQPYLINRDYTFIGPINQSLFEPFIRRANQLAPVVAITRSVHHALSNRQATLQALDIFPPNTPLRIYVITRMANNILNHQSIEDYCRNNNINFP